MKTNDFTTTILVDKTPKQVFDAIKNPQLWWSGEIEGSAQNLNDEFTYRYKEFHYSKQRIIEMIPDQKIVWLVTESSINFVDDKAEWTNTKITFEISQQDNKTLLRFSHLGLVPEIECFNNCTAAWNQLIHQGLFTLITTGKTKTIVLG